jgi:hypothetical protein
MFRRVTLTAGLLVGIKSAVLADRLPIAIVSMTAQVAPGRTVTLGIQAPSGATCQGNQLGHFGDVLSVPLPPHRIRADGRAQWQWSVLRA